MPNQGAEAFEDGIDLQIGLIDANLPDLETGWPCYPFLPLSPAHQQEMRTFRTIILENPYLRATVLPGLGGRIVSLFDKRTSTEILRRHPMIEPQSGGRRGAYVREGVEIWLDGTERLNSLGNVATQLEHAAREDGDAAVWMAETVTGSGISFHQKLSLPPDAAELQIEVRVFNRWLRPQPYNGGLSLYVGAGEFDGSTFFSAERDAGLGIFADEALFDGVSYSDGFVRFLRFTGMQSLAPRQVDAWTLTLAPLSGLKRCLGASRHAALSLVDGVIRVQTSKQRMQHKLLMLTEEGQTLESGVDLYPEHVLEIAIEGLKPIEFVLLDPAKQELLRAGINGTTTHSQGHSTEPIGIKESGLRLESARNELLRSTFDIETRHLAHTLLAMKALASSRPLEANQAFELALNFNADDPLLWWAKALTARIADQDNEAELLNAHYLAPLEPALRSESFLSQPVNPDPAPNPLLNSLEENPEEFIEVACLLIEIGLFDQASRWLDEAVRHRDLPMLRYLTSYCLITRTKLVAEAAEQVRIAGKSPIGPPFPYRDIERKAIAALRQAFPDDVALAQYGSYLEASGLSVKMLRDT